MAKDTKSTRTSNVNTGGGAYVGGNVSVDGGSKFVGRDDKSTAGLDAEQVYCPRALTALMESRVYAVFCPLKRLVSLAQSTVCDRTEYSVGLFCDVINMSI
jgi:hypothetical protein